MSTAALGRKLQEQQIAAQLAEVAALNPGNNPFPDNDAALAEQVRKLGEASEERAKLRSEEAKEQYDNLVRANVIKAQQREQDKKDEIERYYGNQQARDQRAEADVARRFQLLTETQRGPEDVDVWRMDPARLRYLAETASMAKQFLSPEQMAALDAHTDPFLQSPDPSQQTQQPAAQVASQPQPQHPETFPDGSLVQIKQDEDGTLEAKLITGEVFRGDPLTITRKIGEANVHTKRWAKGLRSKQQQQTEAQQASELPQPTNPNSAVSFAPDGTPQVDFSKIPNVVGWQLDQMAQSLGYSDGAEMVQDQIAQRQKTQELERRLKEREERDFILETSSNFLAANPDFPNTDQSIAALEQIINQKGWEWSAENMQAAHALALRQKLYEALSIQEQGAAWEQGLRESNNRPTPPPMLSSGNPDASNAGRSLWEIPMPELRALAIQEQLKGRQ